VNHGIQAGAEKVCCVHVKIPQELTLQIAFYEGFGGQLLDINVRFYAGFEGFAGWTNQL
jgi:hypothetical protein